MKNFSFSDPTLGVSLLGTMARSVIFASILGMLTYTLVEYVIQRPNDWADFFLHHLLHTLIIVGVVALVASLTLRELVIKPVSRIFIHLKRMAAGRIENIQLECQSDEIRSVVESINNLAIRLRTTGKEDSLSQALDDIRDIRKLLRESLSDSDAAVAVMRSFTRLENRLLDVLQQHGEWNGQR
jgi:methyl-accepting chemotaxis protein